MHLRGALRVPHRLLHGARLPCRCIASDRPPQFTSIVQYIRKRAESSRVVRSKSVP
jgi:hypothetical protein